VLSDSRDPALAAEEERSFRRVAFSAGTRIPIFYRRRKHNTRHKAGNLAEFFERWGHRYTYAIVLDADSLMEGGTVLELVRRMHASPRLALLQAPIELHGAETLFARVLQFSASLFGPIFTAGLAAWSGARGNYYGHNAIVRVEAFLDCCALPTLAGKPPFGGDILSHDFVEAALLCRGGWEVRIAADLSGSFEGLPPAIPAYVARDRRWCQGNLQHLRVACARGLHPISRLHLLLGACAYLESPAWLCFVALGVGLSHVSATPFSAIAWLVAAATALWLLGPQLLGLVAALRDGERSRGHGGRARLLLGFVVQLLLGACLAPLIMLHRTRIVLSLLLGQSVRWGSQDRAHTPGLIRYVRSEGLTMALGIAASCALWFWSPDLFLWLSPVWIPWTLAVPLAWLLSSRFAGDWARRLGCLIVPSEIQPHELRERADTLRALTAPDDSARFRDLVLDPVLASAHLAQLEGASSRPTTEALMQLRQRALRTGPAGLSPRERSMLASDAASMRWLHGEAWRHWPVESWQVARERPQVPADESERFEPAASLALASAFVAQN
jgi:membrane glycosyltransferase